MDITLHKNMRQADAIDYARRLGCSVRVNGHKRVYVRHGLMPGAPWELSRHKRDVTQGFVSWLRRLRALTTPIEGGGE